MKKMEEKLKNIEARLAVLEAGKMITITVDRHTAKPAPESEELLEEKIKALCQKWFIEVIRQAKYD